MDPPATKLGQNGERANAGSVGWGRGTSQKNKNRLIGWPQIPATLSLCREEPHLVGRTGSTPDEALGPARPLRRLCPAIAALVLLLQGIRPWPSSLAPVDLSAPAAGSRSCSQPIDSASSRLSFPAVSLSTSPAAARHRLRFACSVCSCSCVALLPPSCAQRSLTPLHSLHTIRCCCLSRRCATRPPAQLALSPLRSRTSLSRAVAPSRSPPAPNWPVSGNSLTRCRPHVRCRWNLGAGVPRGADSGPQQCPRQRGGSTRTSSTTSS